jgi:putative ABC transport system permease protein
MVVYLGNGNLNHFLIRLANDRQWKTHLSQVEKVVKSLNPGYPFTFRFTDDEHQQQFKGDFGLEQLSNIFSVMAILISCLGLFGMSGFVIERRKKEVSIRKVLGATSIGLWLSLSRQMLKPVFLAVIIATPLAFLVLQPALTVNEYHIHLSWWFFAVAGIGSVGVAFATVSYHGIRASRMNPARALQTE